MYMLLIGCMSAKINKLEQDIAAVQMQNAALEAQVVQLEADVQKMEQSMEELQPVIDMIEHFGAPSPPSARKKKGLPPDWEKTNTENSKNAPTINLSITKEQIALINQQNTENSLLRTTLNRTEDGYVKGYRLTGIRRMSLPYELGFKNGDVLVAVNGKPIYPKEEALKRYQEVEQASSFTLLLIRRNTYQKLQFSVQE